MARFGKRFDVCPKCGKTGFYAPKLWFGEKLAPGTWPRMCKYCGHTEIRSEK